MDSEEPLRCPRTDDEVAALLNTRPDGWEYLLYGGALYLERQRLEAKYRDHVFGYAELAGDPLDLNQAIREAQAAFPDALSISATLMQMFDPARYERAFGAPGTAGNADLIRHLAKRTVDGYAELMRWARRLRSLRVPREMQQVFRLAADMMDGPVEQCRRYMDDVLEQFDQTSELLARADADPDVTEEDPLVVELQLTLSVEDDAVDRYASALEQAETELLDR